MVPCICYIGVLRNEIADRLAKEATSSNGPSLNKVDFKQNLTAVNHVY